MLSVDRGLEEPPANNPISELDRRIEQFSNIAQPLLERYSLGLDPRFVRDNLGRLRSILAGTGQPGVESDSSLAVLGRLEGTAWNTAGFGEHLWQSVSHAAGALMTSSMWAERTDPALLRRAMVAKTLYEHITEILDDIIDTGEYTRRAAARLYGATLQPLSQPRIDVDRLQGELLGAVTSSTAGFAAPLVGLVVALRDELARAPRAPELRELFSLGNRYLAQGQSLSVLLQGRRVDVAKVRFVARRFYAPSDGDGWVDRLGKYMSHVSNLTLLDLSFVGHGGPLGDLNEHLWAWYYLDALISVMNHLADLEADSRAGIVNLALLKMRPEGPAPGCTPFEAYETLSVEDYDLLLENMAGLSARALVHAERSDLASLKSYRLLTLMIPVVMFSAGKDRTRALLPAYLRKLESRVNLGRTSV